MYKQKKNARSMILLLASMLCIGCEYTPLDDTYDDWTIQSVIVDWDYSKIDSIPQSFRIAFYPSDAETRDKMPDDVLLFDVYNKRAVLRNIPVGRYNITAWNTDTEHNIISNITERDSLCAEATAIYTTDDSQKKILDSIYHEQPIYNTPDYMTHCNEDTITVLADKIQHLKLTPDSMTTTITYTIHGINALELASKITLVMDGIAERRYIGKDTETTGTCTIMTECQKDEKNKLIHGSFHVFGIQQRTRADTYTIDNTITLSIWLDDGNRVYIPLDTATINENTETGSNTITIDIPDLNIDLLDYTSSGTFDVSVSDWNNIEQEISW